MPDKNDLAKMSAATFQREFHMDSVLDYVKTGIASIIEDEVTQRFVAEELKVRVHSGLTKGHYLMGVGPNFKKILHNSGMQIRIPEGMLFDNLLSIKSQNVGHWRKITKPLFSRCIYYISSIFSLHKSKTFVS